MALTKSRIDRAEYRDDGPSRQIIWDNRVPGFGLRLYPSGKKSFVIQYRDQCRRTRLMTLGSYGVLTPAQARELATRRLLEVAQGEDPLAKRRSPSAGTVRDFVEVWLGDHARPNRKTWREDQRRLVKHVIPTLGTKALSAVQRADVARLHARLGSSTPVEANRVRMLLHNVFAKAEEWGYLPEGHPNPAHGVKPLRESARERWLTETEVRSLFESLEAEDDPYVRAAFPLLLLTGLRKGELLSLRWEDVDLQRSELRLPATKSGRPHSIPLTGPALGFLSDIPRLKGNPWVFPGAKGGPLRDLRRPWLRVRRRAGLDDVTIHDLRRTTGSWMAQKGVPLQVIGKVLNHSHPAVTRIYARLNESQIRDALEAQADAFKRALGER